MLLDEAALANPALQAVGVDHLHVLTSGPLPPNPADVFGLPADGSGDCCAERTRDYVLFDVPPALAVTDAALLGLKVDGLLLVLRAGTSRRDHAARAKAELERVERAGHRNRVDQRPA